MTVLKERMRRLMAKFGRSRFRYMEVRDGAISVTAVRKPGAAKPAVSTAADTADFIDDEAVKTVPKPSIPSVAENDIPQAQAVTPLTLRSPRVGHFYFTDKKKKKVKEPIEVGSELTTGQIIGMIESMKIRYEVKTDLTGIVEALLVEDGEAVEYGQPLARLKEPTEAS